MNVGLLYTYILNLTSVYILVVIIVTTFWPLYSTTFFRGLSLAVTFWEFLTEPFIQSMGIDYLIELTNPIYPLSIDGGIIHT